MYFFTSDIHLGDALSVKADNRPFRSDKQFEKFLIKSWNKQAKKNDTIFVVGDLFDCHSKTDPYFLKKLNFIKKIKANIILVMGNNEEKIINYFYNGNFDEFKKVLISCGIKDFQKNYYVDICEQTFFLTHKPKEHHSEYLTLFGHSHRSMGIYKSFGFNIGCDLNHFLLFSEDDINALLKAKKDYWDHDYNLTLI